MRALLKRYWLVILLCMLFLGAGLRFDCQVGAESKDSLHNDVNYKRAVAALELELWDSSIKYFKELEKSHPENPLVLYYLGALRAIKGDVIPAVVYLRKYLESKKGKIAEVPKTDDEIAKQVFKLEALAEKRTTELFNQAIKIARDLPDAEIKNRAWQACVRALVHGRRLDRAARLARERPNGTLSVLAECAVDICRRDDECSYSVEVFDLAEEIALLDIYPLKYHASDFTMLALPDPRLPPEERAAAKRLHEQRLKEKQEILDRKAEPIARKHVQTLSLVHLALIEKHVGLGQKAYECSKKNEKSIEERPKLSVQLKTEPKLKTVVDRLYTELKIINTSGVFPFLIIDHKGKIYIGPNDIDRPFSRFVEGPTRWLIDIDYSGFYDFESAVRAVQAKGIDEKTEAYADLAQMYSLALYLLEKIGPPDLPSNGKKSP